MSSTNNRTLYELEKKLLEPSSQCYVENLLDVICTLVQDCNFPSAKNSHGVLSFVKRYADVAHAIDEHRTRYSDFEILKTIGQGAFGRVELARHKRTRSVYAIKSMSKQQILERNLAGFWVERDVMVKVSSDWLLTCHYAFLDKNNVYLCTEYMPGGDLCYWLAKYDTFDETITRFYLAEVVLAVEVLHKAGFIHGDLKPDNMMLDSHGHLKLGDFGTCMVVDKDGYYYCSSPIGTPDYISPEMLDCQRKPGKINPSCDWWTLGVIAYEMLYGNPPFFGDSLAYTYNRILSHETSLTFPTDADPVEEVTIQFIKSLLRPMSKRLGSLDLVTDIELNEYKNNRPLAAAQQIKSHPFFKSIQWDQLRAQEPPIIPKVNSETDTSHIDFSHSEVNSDFNLSDGGNKKVPQFRGGAFASTKPASTYFTGTNLTFAGYSYNRHHHYFEQCSQLPINANTNETVEKSKQFDQLEHELKQLKSKYETLECQCVQNEISLKDAQRRLVEMTNESEQIKHQKLDLDKSNNELLTQLLNAQSERDHVQSTKSELNSQMKILQNNMNSSNRYVEQLKQEKLELSNQLETIESRCAQFERELAKQQSNNSSDHSSASAQNSQLVKTLQLQIEQLESEIKESRFKSTVLINEVVNLRHNHSEQIKELNDQLQSAQSVNADQSDRLHEMEDQLEQFKLNEKIQQRDKTHMHDQLEQMVNLKRQLEDKLVSCDSALAVANVRLRTMDNEMQNLRKQYDTDIKNMSNQIDTGQIELQDVSNQLDEMRVKCATAETNCDRLTNDITKRDAEIEKLHRNMQLLVDKLYSECDGRLNPTTNKSNTKAVIDLVKYKLLEKRYKKLELSHQKEIADLNRVIEEYEKKMTDQVNDNKLLSEECETKHKEIEHLKHVESTLRTRLDHMTLFQSSSSKLMVKQAKRDSTMQQNSETSSTTDSDDLRSENSISSLGHSFKPDRLNTILNGMVDIYGLSKSKRKIKWHPQFVVIKPFVLSIYETNDSDFPTDEFPLHQITHVRNATELDLFRSTKDEVSRVIQFLLLKKAVKNDAVTDHTNDNQNSLNKTICESNGNLSNTPATTAASNDQQPSHWNGHQFHSIRYRVQNVLCGHCHKICSDLLSPPLVLECVNCHLRLHAEHVEKQAKILPCYDVFYIRFSSSATQKHWIDHINSLRVCFKECQDNANRITEYGLSELVSEAGGLHYVGLHTPTSLKGLRQSARKGSIRPASMNVCHRVDSITSLDLSMSVKSAKNSSPAKSRSPLPTFAVTGKH